MGIDVLVTLLSAIATIVGGLSGLLLKRLADQLKKKKTPEISYKDRMEALVSNLAKASEGVDSILKEIAGLIKSKESAVKTLEERESLLTKKGEELERKIEVLEGVTPEAAKYFAELTNQLASQSEKRGAKRDYILFGAGVVATTIIAIILQLLAG